MRCLGIVLLSLGLFGCGSQAPKDPTELPTLENFVAKGAYEVVRQEPSRFETSLRNEPFEYSAYYPSAQGRFPLIVFSHGSLCDADYNAALSEHWASHGYVVIQPRHLDAAPATFESGLDPDQVWNRRRQDMQIAVDSIDRILTSFSQWRGELSDLTVAAGHSYGGLTAQATAGARTGSFVDPAKTEQFSDDRFDVVVAIAPPGAMGAFVSEKTGEDINKPMLVVVGTNDVFPPIWSEWESHRLTYDSGDGSDQYLAIIEGADHRYGGLICSRKDDPPQPKLLGLASATTLLFLASQNDGDSARQLLKALAEGSQSVPSMRFEGRLR